MEIICRSRSKDNILRWAIQRDTSQGAVVAGRSYPQIVSALSEEGYLNRKLLIILNPYIQSIYYHIVLNYFKFINLLLLL